MTVASPASGLSGQLGLASEAYVAEVQTISVTGSPTGGSFPVVFGGQSATIAYNSTAAAAGTALNALATITGVGGVTTGGGPLPASPITVTFAKAGNQPSLVLGANGLTGGTTPTPAVATTTPGTGYGSGATPTRFLPAPANSTVALQIQPLESTALLSGNQVLRTQAWALNRKGVTGDREFDFSAVGMSLLIQHMLGVVPTITTPTSGVLTRQHTFAGIGDPAGMSLCWQEGIPTAKGVMNPRTVKGVKVTDWTFTGAVDQFLKLKVTIDGMDLDNTTALATAAYPAAFLSALQSWAGPFASGGGSLQINGSPVPVKGFTLTGASHLDTTRYFLANTYQKQEPLRNAYVDVTGSLDFDYMDEALWTAWTTGALSSLVLNYQGGLIENVSTPGPYYYGVKITLPNARYDGSDPTNSTMDVIPQTVPFKALYDGTNPVLSIVVTTTDTVA